MDKFTFFTVVEKQISQNGTPGTLTYHFDGDNAEPLALSKYYTVLAAAATSATPYHAAFIIRDDGITIESRVFDRRTDPEPEPEVNEPQGGEE